MKIDLVFTLLILAVALVSSKPSRNFVSDIIISGILRMSKLHSYV